jgi:large subunit ribosomal protein L29
MRVREINALSTEDRAKKLADLRIELARIRTMVNAGGAVENPTRIRELRRSVAQILTIQNEKKLGIRQTAAVEEREKRQEKKAKKPSKLPKTEKTVKETVS